MRTPDDIRDEWLVLEAQRGVAAALAELVQRWQQRLTLHALRLLGEGDAARDAAQDAWVAIVKGLPRLDDPRRFRAWAYRIVGNKCTDWMRRNHRDVPLDHEPQEDPATSEQNPVSELRAALNSMHPDKRTLLAMFYVDGMSVREIATATALPEGTIKSRLYHARTDLRARFERMNDE